MAATFEFDESNAAGQTITHNVTNVNWKNIDDATTAYSSSPITAGNNSFEKWQFGHFSGTYNQILSGLFAHTATAFGAFYRRKRAQGGPLHAQVATANKIARTVYHLLKYHVQYQALGVEAFERQHRERDVKALRKKASKLGFTLVESHPTPATA